MSGQRVVVPPAASRSTMRTIALFEGFKGLLVLVIASGALALVHRDVEAIALRLVEHAHLDPTAKLPRIFLDAAAQAGQGHLAWLAAAAAGYAIVRLVEAYGLWRSRPWAEWLAALGGAIYLPLELLELARKPTIAAALVLAANLAIVAYLSRAIVARRRARR